MKKSFLLIITLCFVLALSSVPAFAGTTLDTNPPTSEPITNKLTDKEITQIRNIMTKDGVNQETQNSLINKIQKGEILDSENPEKLAAVPKGALSLKKGEMKKIYVFPDGSYRKTYMIPIIPQNKDMLLEAIGDESKVDSLLAPKSSKFSIQSQTLDIWVQDGTYAVQGGFSVNFYLSDSNNSVINFIYGPSVWCLFGSSDPATWQLSIPAKKEIDFAYCHARFRYIYVNNGQQTLGTSFYVSGGQYWTEYEY